MYKKIRIVPLILLAVISCCLLGTVIGKYKSTLSVGTFDLTVISDKYVFSVVEDGKMTVYHRLISDNDDGTVTIENGEYDIVVDKSKVFTFVGSNNLAWGYSAIQGEPSVPNVNKTNVTSITFADEIAISSGVNMFYGYSNCTSIEGLYKLDTASCTSMVGMFQGCTNLATLDLTGLDTSGVESMRSMFNGCKNLTALDLTVFDTSKVEDMYAMFEECTKLATLTWDVKKFDTSNVTNIARMFFNCNSLTALDLSHFNTENVTVLDRMFYSCSSLTELDVTSFDTSKASDMTHMFEGCKKLTSLDVSSFDTSNVWSFRNMFTGCSGLTSLDVSKFNTKSATAMGSMFSGCSGLTSLDISNFNTSKVDAMGGMFANCSNLVTLTWDNDKFDTSNVTGFGSMFYDCEKLAAIDVSKFNTAKATALDRMFYSCKSLTELNLSSFDTSSVKDMTFMFGSLTLESLDLTSFNTESVEVMECMFEASGNLTTIYVSDKFILSETAKGTSIVNGKERDNDGKMFNGCTNLVGGNGTSYKTAQVKDGSYALIDGKEGMHGYFTYVVHPIVNTDDLPGVTWDFNGAENFAVGKESSIKLSGENLTKYVNLVSSVEGVEDAYVLVENGVVTIPAEMMVKGSTITIGFPQKYAYAVLDENNALTIHNRPGLLTTEGDKTQLLTVDGDVYTLGESENVYALPDGVAVDKSPTGARKWDELKTVVTSVDVVGEVKIKSGRSLFNEFIKCTSMDLTGLDTSAVTDMYYMFAECYELTSLDLSSFNTSGVTNMYCMFWDCNKLPSLDLSSFDTSAAKNMSWMFGEAYKLETLTLSDKFKTSLVTDMSSMFLSCNSLKRLDLSSFDTSKVTNMESMFSGCSSLINLDVSTFDTSEVTTMKCMFQACNKLNSLDLSSFDTSKVTTMWYMFYDCHALTKVDVSNFNTSAVTNMYSMFYKCHALTDVDLSSFNTSIVTDMSYMFDGCNALTKLNLSNFNTSGVTKMENMFHGCNALTELNLSNFNTSGVTQMQNMFSGCNALTKLDLANFNTSKVTDMQYMFANCHALTSLDLSSFNTSGVTNMYCMFWGCSRLSSLDVSSFDTSGVTNMSWMFADNGALTTIYVSDRFVTDAVSNSVKMFQSCGSLKGGNGTTPAAIGTVDDKTHARIDGMNGQLGYFTLLIHPILNATDLSDLTWSIDGTGSFTPGNAGSLKLTGESLPEYVYLVSSAEGVASAFVPVENGVFTVPAEMMVKRSTVTISHAAMYVYSVLDDSGKLSIRNRPVFLIENETKQRTSGTTLIEQDGTYNISDLYTVGGTLASGTKLPGTKSLDAATKSKITKITIENKIALSSANNLFSGFGNCEQILGLDNLNTAQCTDMSYMFDNCLKLSYLDSTGFETSKVTNMTFMFGKTKLTTEVFNALLSKFDTSNVTNFYGMFWNCSSVTELDLSHFNTPKATDIKEMFQGCSNLEKLTFGENFNTSNVTTMHQTFYGCSKLAELDLSGFDTSKVTDMSNLFGGCSSLTKIDLSKFNTSNVKEMDSMFNDCRQLSDIIVGDDFNTSKVTTMYFMFGGATSLTDEVFARILKNFDTSNVTNLYGMFRGCSTVTTLDLSHFKTNSPASMQEMFQNCSNLTTLQFAPYDATNSTCLKVSNMDRTFAGCSKLKELNLSSFNTSTVENMYSMLNGCGMLTTITVSDLFDTSKVENMSFMFSNAKSLTDETFASLLSKFDTSNVTNFYATFGGCTATILDLSNFNTSSATTMQEMFVNCSRLTTLKLSENFTTSNVSTMYRMFDGCSALPELNLSSFDTSKVTDMKTMFNKCSHLVTIYASDSFVTTGVTNSTNMFDGCSALKGGNGTTLAAVKTNDEENYLTATYARIDGKYGQPGYFTVTPHNDHGETSYTVNADGTHTEYCGVYGEPIKTENCIYENSACTVCGNDCTHSTLENYASDTNAAETHHGDCLYCGKQNISESHSFSGNVCSKCNYVCTHKITWTITAENHSGNCTICNTAIEGETHTYENGVCSKCQYVCVHSNIVNGKCSLCGVAVYTLVFNSNEGTNAPEAVTNSTSTVEISADTIPTREGYVFLGYDTNKDVNVAEVTYKWVGDGFSQDFVFDETDTDTTATLYAIWSDTGVKFKVADQSLFESATQEFEFVAGMTWGAWVKSDYNKLYGHAFLTYGDIKEVGLSNVFYYLAYEDYDSGEYMVLSDENQEPIIKSAVIDSSVTYGLRVYGDTEV